MPEPQTTFASDFLASAGVDLFIEPGAYGVRRGLSDALRDAVRTGRLGPKTRLPSSRLLASDLGIARSTVTECYAELVAEGWLTAQRGSGTRVADRIVLTRRAPSPASDDKAPSLSLLPGAPDFAEFPRGPWLAAARRALSLAPPTSFGYGDPLGRMELRTELAAYLARVRGVYADPDHIIITSGFHSGLKLIAEALTSRGATSINIEDYGLNIYRSLLRDSGLRQVPLPIDGDGMVVNPDSEADALLLTPAHQFPTGVVMSPERRMSAANWARRTGGFIIEDDYDGEFRYDKKPVGALQGLAPEQVIYVGTTSKSLAPALRLAWLIVPEQLRPAVAAAKGRVEVVSVLEQLTLAEFIRSGAFDRHIRSRRNNYRRRRDELVFSVQQISPEITVTGVAAGLQAVIGIPRQSERRVLEAAVRHGLMVSGMSEFRHECATSPTRDALIINFSAPSDSVWPTTLNMLCQVLRENVPVTGS